MGRLSPSKYAKDEYDEKLDWSSHCKGGNHDRCANQNNQCGCGCHHGLEWLKRTLLKCDKNKRPNGAKAVWKRKPKIDEINPPINEDVTIYFCKGCLQPFNKRKNHKCPVCSRYGIFVKKIELEIITKSGRRLKCSQ